MYLRFLFITCGATNCKWLVSADLEELNRALAFSEMLARAETMEDRNILLSFAALLPA
jgi:hypothetical protein